MKIRAYKEFTTNIAGLPEGEYVTETGYSDCYPYKVIRKTKTTMTVIPVKTRLADDWRPEADIGGFCAHVTNNDDQRYVFDGFADGEMTIRLRKSRYSGSDKLYGISDAEFIINGAVRKYDYNF